MINRKELSNKLAEAKGITKKEAETYVDSIIDIIVDELVADGKVSISGILTLETVPTKERIGRNPATKEEIKIEASKKVKATIGSTLKNAVKGK